MNRTYGLFLAATFVALLHSGFSRAQDDSVRKNSSVAKILVSSSDGTTYGGSCVIVSTEEDLRSGEGRLGYALSAFHTSDSLPQLIRVEYTNGDVSKDCFVVRSHRLNDLAVIRVWVPDEVDPIGISDKELKIGDSLKAVGYPRANKQETTECKLLRRFSDNAREVHTVSLDLEVIPGQSGGAILSDGDLVGIILRGMSNPGSVETPLGEVPRDILWPTSAASRTAIKNIMQGLKPSQLKREPQKKAPVNKKAAEERKE